MEVYHQPVPLDLAPLIPNAFSLLTNLTDSVYGLQYSDTSQWQNWQPSSTDIVLNAWASCVLSSYRPPPNPVSVK